MNLILYVPRDQYIDLVRFDRLYVIKDVTCEPERELVRQLFYTQDNLQSKLITESIQSEESKKEIIIPPMIIGEELRKILKLKQVGVQYKFLVPNHQM